MSGLTFPRTKIARFAADAMKSGDKKAARKIAAFLVKNGQTNQLNSLSRDILQLRADEQGIVEVTAVSARDQEPQTISAIKNMIKSTHPGTKDVIVNQRIESDVIGGIRLEFANELMTDTVQSRLNNLKDKAVRDN